MYKKKSGKNNPLYLQIAEGLEKMIADEILKIGDKLPSPWDLEVEEALKTVGTLVRAHSRAKPV